MTPLRLTLLLALLSSTTAAPTLCPGQSTLFGYSNWATLQDDINNLDATSTTADATFVICPSTTFLLTDAISGNHELRFNVDPAVMVAPITLTCGASGDPADGCVIRGGWHHVWVQRVGKLTFQGISFEEASRGSVWTGTGMDEIAFVDCIWRDNVYSWTAMGDIRCPTGCSAAVGGRNGATSFENCEFHNNEGDSGAVYGENMAYSFDGCRFQNNTATAREVELKDGGTPPTGSTITLVHPASTLYLANNCFIDNQSHGPATVLVEDTSIAARQSFTSLRVNSNNFFLDNRVAQSNRDSSFQWCHNSIYNYIEGNTDFTFDDCVPGNADCCQCKEATDNTDEEGGDGADNINDLQSDGSSASRSTVAASLVVMLVGWRMV